MKVVVIIVGIGQWEEYTKPLVLSIQKHEPTAGIIVVDNGNLLEKEMENIKWCTTDEIVSYAAAINVGTSALDGDEDWVIIINNDVICYKPFFKNLDSMRNNVLYGNKIHNKEHKHFTAPTNWIDGWLYAIPKQIFEKVGKWDEAFKIAGFEDADYCFRAHEMGYKIKSSRLSFKHLGYHIRKKMFPNYKRYKGNNMRYLKTKHGI